MGIYCLLVQQFPYNKFIFYLMRSAICNIIHVSLLSLKIWYYLRERSGRVLDSRQRDRGFEPHRRNNIVVLEQDIFIPA